MYIKLLYNIKNNKNNKKEGGVWVQGARFDPKPSQVGEKDENGEKRKREKNVFGAGIEPTTLRLQILYLTH